MKNGLLKELPSIKKIGTNITGKKRKPNNTGRALNTHNILCLHVI
jgi:hypothetical protein